MLTLILHGFTRAHEQVLHTVLSSQYKVFARRRPELIVELAAHGVVDAVLIALGNLQDEVMLTTVARIRLAAPIVYVVGYTEDELDRKVLALLPDAIHAGLSEIVTGSAIDISNAISAAITNTPRVVITKLFQDELSALPDGIVRIYCVYTINHAISDTSFADLLTSLGVAHPKLLATFRRHGHGGPQRLFKRVRLLAALTLLRESNRSPESIAPVLGFRSGDALRRALARETGCGARGGYDKSAFDCLVQTIRSQLRGNAIGDM